MQREGPHPILLCAFSAFTFPFSAFTFPSFDLKIHYGAPLRGTCLW